MPRVCCILALFALAIPLRAADPPSERDPMASAAQGAVDRGLAFLQSQQKPDGSFHSAGPGHAADALATLAFLSAGHVPDVGKYGLTVRGAADRLLAIKTDNGYFGRDGSRMTGHAIVTITLCQLYGAEADDNQRRKMRSAIDKALRVLYSAQDRHKSKPHAGGWRHEPDSSDSDLGTTSWCVLALLAARDAGLEVPRERLERAVTYMRGCYVETSGGFAETPGGKASVALSAAALLNFHLLGVAERAEAQAAAKFIRESPVRPDAPLLYSTLHLTTRAASRSGPPLWGVVWKNNAELLISLQRPDDGSFRPSRDEGGRDDKPGRVQATAMAVLTLTVPLRLLPVFEQGQ